MDMSDVAHSAAGILTSIFVFAIRTMVSLRIFGVLTSIAGITCSVLTLAHATAANAGIRDGLPHAA